MTLTQIVVIIAGSLATLTATVFGLLWFDLWRQRRDAANERVDQALRALFRMDDTQPIDIVDCSWSRTARELHGQTASELAAEAREFSRIERDLSCDADFRAIANRLNAQFPNPT